MVVVVVVVGGGLRIHENHVPNLLCNSTIRTAVTCPMRCWEQDEVKGDHIPEKEKKERKNT
jgi:hypothetical protein